MLPATVQPLYHVSVDPLTAPTYVGASKNESVLSAAGIAVTVAAVSAVPLITPLRLET